MVKLIYMTPEQIDNFWKKVDKTDTCWNWIAHKLNYGYGGIRLNKKEQRAHRISWELHNGEIPKGLHVIHKCDNPPCVNPDHLWLGTHQDNMRDRSKKGRTSRHIGNLDLGGEKHGSSKLKEKQVIEIRNLGKTGIYIQKELADLFGVHQTTINNILNNKYWK